ncbi:STAS domain-containing protein [Paenisporosarcina cavernae]|uniref:STAS domain-containing protein n=1 Tax=Paenisporosarcina cavernae TaxID=2320858 RepID=A0A385YPU9_9BACL|nr:STAS domain-containing protein [Paenisporosarcina cavernae]AYC28626.1 STAS domain-containing protein [Paenisporosarcina cavernae]
MEQYNKVKNYLLEHSTELAKEFISKALENSPIEIPPEHVEISTKANAEFLELLANSFEESEEGAAEELIEWSKQYGEQQAANLANLTTMIKPYAANRLIYLKRISEISMSLGLDTEHVVNVNNRVSFLLDTSMTETIFAYEAYKEAQIVEREREINELSAPLVPLKDAVAILPIIGMIDFNRMEHLLNNVIPEIPRQEIEHVIIDFSGILTIDVEVAHHIYKIHSVLGLLGIHVLFTGIRPNLSLAVVQAGLDFSKFETYSNVQVALNHIEKNI